MKMTVEITTLTNGGDGLGRVDGKAVFVAGTVPGDLVTCRIDVDKKRYAKGSVLEIVTPGAQRIEPLCPHFTRCGGCDWQMMSYEDQCRWKERLLRENCQHQLHLDDTVIKPLHPSKQSTGYRSRVQFKCFQRGADFELGFYQRGSHRVVDISACPVVDPRINALVPWLRKLFNGSKYAAEVGQIDVAVGDSAVARVVIHYTGLKAGGICSWLTGAISEQNFSCFVQTKGGELHHVQGGNDLTIDVDTPTIELAYAAGGFAQINLAQNRLLVDMVIKAVCECENLSCPIDEAHIFDLYCGMGNFSLPLSRRVGQVTAVEGNSGSIRDGKRNAERNGITNVSFHVANVGKFMRALGPDRAGADIVVLDPPRAGIKELVALLIAQRPQRIVYVSCDQQTMLRDLRQLCCGSYRIFSIQSLDMFPQTAHTEVVAILDLV